MIENVLIEISIKTLCLELNKHDFNQFNHILGQWEMEIYLVEKVSFLF